MKNLGYVFLIIMVMVFGFTVYLEAEETVKQEQKVLPKLYGKPIPNFILPRLSGGEMSLDDFRKNSNTMVYFWATWCPNCHEKLIYFDKSKAVFEQKGIKIAIINSGNSKEEILKYLKKHDIDLDMFMDEEETLDEIFGITAVPTIMFVSSEGIVNSVRHGLPKE